MPARKRNAPSANGARGRVASTQRLVKSSTPLDNLLGRLEGVEKRGGPGSYWALCPCHDDRRPSLHVTEVADGTVLTYCFGCQVGYFELLDAVGLEPRDMLPNGGGSYRLPRQASKRPRVRARDLLPMIREELIVGAIVMNRAAGKVDPEDAKLLTAAVQRLNFVLDTHSLWESGR